MNQLIVVFLLSIISGSAMMAMDQQAPAPVNTDSEEKKAAKIINNLPVYPKSAAYKKKLRSQHRDQHRPTMPPQGSSTTDNLN